MAQKINALLIDDDPLALGSLRRMIAKYCPEISISGEAQSAGEARAILRTHTIDTLFLDISMPDENGFEFLESIDRGRYKVVFTTSYDQYTMKAMRMNAFDYLLKPVNILELQQVGEKICKTQNLKPQPSQLTDYKNVLDAQLHKTEKKEISRLNLPDMHGFTIVDVKDIMYLDADHNYTIFHLADKRKIVVSKPIKQYEEVLNPDTFFRIHKSSIINLKHLKEFSKIDGYYAVMTDESSVSVSRRRLPDFMRAVGAFNHIGLGILMTMKMFKILLLYDLMHSAL